MRPKADALSDLIDVLQGGRDGPWRNGEASSASASLQFGCYVAEVCATASPERRGARTAGRIAKRVLAREAEWTRRTAMDLQRLADLDNRMRLRDAESERRRCFVLGRLLSQAARTSICWAEVLELLLDSSTLKPAEAKALGLAPYKARRPSE